MNGKKISCKTKIHYHANESGYSSVEILLWKFGIASVLTAAFTYNDYDYNENVHFAVYLRSYRQNLTKRIKNIKEEGEDREIQDRNNPPKVSVCTVQCIWVFLKINASIVHSFTIWKFRTFAHTVLMLANLFEHLLEKRFQAQFNSRLYALYRYWTQLH